MTDRLASTAESVAEERFGVTPARIQAAGLLRRLGHAFVGHDAPDELFVALCEAIGPFVEQLEGEPVRNRSLISLSGMAGSSLFGEPPGDGERLSHFPDCVVSGAANPMGTAIAVRREADDAVAEVVLGAAFEGAPGRAHGGVVAAIFDDVMGYQLSILKLPAFTGRIEITYRAPTPIEVPLVFRARVDAREERKLHMSASAHADDGRVLIAEATATFIVIPLERFVPGSVGVSE
ncbi:MAG: PaaI family thioesterase [Ilumatobacteraceae bacterium]